MDDLVAAGLVAPEHAQGLVDVADRYAIGLTPTVAALIDPADASDPIAAQYIPTSSELLTTRDELADPIGDQAHSPVKGIVHRYPDRVLLKAVGVCPVYCRFCFRREMVGPSGDGNPTPAELHAAFDYIRSQTGIWEIIVTGGDPLVLSSRRWSEIARALAEIDHVRILRIHSRVPAVDPSSIDEALINAIKSSGKTVYLALHVNHPREMTEDVRAACARLADAGIVLVSQSVLLKGVNDDPSVLAALMRAFVEARVKPYYLHHPDMAPGTGHFRLTIAEGQAIMRDLRTRLSGLCIPSYILDLPGGHGKVSLGEDNVRLMSDGRHAIVDRTGVERLYPEQARDR